MKRKGFTLIELLAVLVIIGVLLGLAIPAVGGYITRGKKSYYNSLEDTLKTAGQDYVTDYKSLLPREIGNTTVVSVEELVENGYMEEIKDEDKETCTGNVTIEKTGKKSYEYYVCLKCNENYTSEAEDCEVSGSNNESKNYEIALNNSVTTVVEQCEEITIPNATVYQTVDGERSLITSSLNPSPKTVDTKILGETTVKWVYRYKSINKTIRVEDNISPTKPEVSLTKINGKEYIGKTTTGIQDITNQNIKLTVKSYDYACYSKYPSLKGSGISNIEYRVKGEKTWTKVNTTKETTNITLTETIYGEVELRVSDKYGNKSEITTFEAYVDQVKPGKTTVTYIGGSNNHSWKNNYKLELSAVDDIAVAYYEIDYDNDGIADATTDSTYIPVNGFSYCKVRFRAVDIAGNRGEWSGTNEIHMDTAKPSIVTISLGSYTSGNWTNKDVLSTYTATDSLSGIDKYQYSYDKTKIIGTTTNNWTEAIDGEYTIYVRAVDKAGNIGEWSSAYYIKRDTVKPSCTLKVSNNASIKDGYYTSKVNIDFDTKRDDRSGVSSATLSTNSITSNTSGTKVIGTIIDKAGNSNTCTIDIKADMENPKVTVKENPLNLAGETYTFTNNVEVTYGNLSGSLSCTPAISAEQEKNYSVTCTATGNNGKTTSVTFNVALCSYDEGTTWTFDYTGGEQEFEIPCSGNYKLEVWGAQGGGARGGAGGKGGYAYGNVTLSRTTNLSIVVGGQGSGKNTSSWWSNTASGGYNGGGAGGIDGDGNDNGNNETGGGGGGYTIIKSSSTSTSYLCGGGGGGNRGYGAISGHGGTGSAGGGGGSGPYTNNNGGNGSGSAECGNTKIGGDGASYSYSPSSPGVGSGWLNTLLTNGSTKSGVQSGNGYARITYLGN